MSTSYGSVTVQFPGFKAFRFPTVNGVMCVSYNHRFCCSTCVALPNRGLVLETEKRKLSRKERSALRSLSKKWNRRSRQDANYRWVRPFRTLDETSY